MIQKIFVGDRIILLKPHKKVYFPAEDSFLLLKNLKNIKGKILEIGTGSGIISIYLAKKGIEKIYATDINKKAIENAQKNARINKVENKIKFIYSDLFENIKNQKFDYIIFNPPYLPTTKEEKIKDELNSSFDGGKNGLKIIRRFLIQAKNFLKKQGVIYLIVSDLADLEKLKTFIYKNGYSYKEIDRQSFFFERIILYKIYTTK
ncbi:MAG: class I SAM-dependent methyltransferase [Candidatus Micrarchaeota archaeon]|nr:class I SAM-dependent methyltransferase [Candidatus Micrarchaeota archaeon]